MWRRYEILDFAVGTAPFDIQAGDRKFHHPPSEIFSGLDQKI
jgi:hypothetical protein